MIGGLILITVGGSIQTDKARVSGEQFKQVNRADKGVDVCTTFVLQSSYEETTKESGSKERNLIPAE